MSTSAATSTADARRPLASPRLCAAALGVGLLTALLVATGARAQALPTAKSPADSPARRGASDASPVVATVDGRVISTRELAFRIFEQRLEDPTLWAEDDDALARALVTSAVDELLLERAFYRGDIQFDDSSIATMVEEAWDRYIRLAGSPSELDILLARAGLQAADVRGWLAQGARRLALIDDSVVERLDPALRNRTDQTPDRATRVLLGMILVAPRTANTPEALEEARGRAIRLRHDLASGMAFEEAARLYSDDRATARRSGDLGWVEMSALDPALREAVGKLRLDKASDPVATPQGYMVIRLRDFETPERMQLDAQARAIRLKELRRMRETRDVRLAPGWTLEPLPEE